MLIAKKLEWLVMAISNSISRSSTLKFDNVVDASLARKCDGKAPVRHQVML